MSTKITRTINLDKKYFFPKRVTKKEFNDKIIIIAPDTGNWLILDNKEQLAFFELLCKYTIQDALNNFSGTKNNAIYVITQIEAKKFDNINITKTEYHKILVYLTNKCNLFCPHCFMESGCSYENELSHLEIIKFLKQASAVGYKKVTFTGGEICTRQDLLEIIKETHRLGYEIELLTNGTLWTDVMIKEIAPLVSEVQISIDGFNEDENSRIRGKGNFNKSIQALDQFIQNGVNTRVAVTPFYDENLADKISLYSEFTNNLLQKYKDKKFEINYTANLLKGREVDLSQEEQEKYSKLIRKITASTSQEKEIAFIKRHRQFQVLDNCSFGVLHVNSVGDIFACSRLSELKPFANIRKDSFEKIMELSNLAKKLTNIDSLEPCKNCDLKYICGGGCRLVYFNELKENADYKNLKLKPRECSLTEKNTFYQLMIDSNKSIFQ